MNHDTAWMAVNERWTVHIEQGPHKGQSGKAVDMSLDPSNPNLDDVIVDLGDQKVSVSRRYLSKEV